MNDAVVSEQEEINGIVEKITYKNEQNGYTVCTVKHGRESITVVGILPFLSQGDNVKFFGNFTVHQTYGRQFLAVNFERTAPKTAAAILRYLSSGVIKGVGPATANRIVEKFGADSLEIIQNAPEQLSLLKGISTEKAFAISEEYKKQYGIREIMLLLSPYDVSLEKCISIFKNLGSQAGEIIKDNPYVLCNADIGLSFEKVEIIASDFGISSDNELRLSAGIEYILRRNLANGHTCLPRNKLTNVAISLLESDELRIECIIDKMISGLFVRTKTVGNTDFIMLPEYYNAEEYIAARLFSTSKHICSSSKIDDLEIDYVENKLGFKFEKMQREAIKSAFQNGILILTGGPGTGKTTTLNAIIALFEQRNAYVQLAAPTGRAAKRMTDLTGREAKTIHRLLEVEWTSDEKQKFSRNERNPLECDVIIVDEASMIDSLLFESLMRAVRINCRIILVGDTNQLPSVSAGNVLNDILMSDKFPSICLKKVFRQSRESAIITNAHAVINKEAVDFSNSSKDFFMLRRDNPYDACNTIIELCTERLPKAYGYNNLTDIQVICPSRKAETGTVNLNNLLQQSINPNPQKNKQLSYKGIYYRVGDKVMQIKNNYDMQWQRDDGEIGFGVYNGDIGFITDIDILGGIINVRFDDRTATYFTENIGELELAYAITVHKSQGSEFDCVIVPMIDIPPQLMYQNLLYTAITRAKKHLIIVGNEYVFYKMAENDRKTLRYTMLKEFINGKYDI